MLYYNSQFSYPPLPTGVDAIRVLTVESGDFHDPLVCTLVPAAFIDRPKYVALSYTGANSYPDNSKLPISPSDARPLHLSPSTSLSRLRSPLLTIPGERGPGLGDQGLTDVLPRRGAISSQITPSNPVALTLNGQPFYIGHNLKLALLHLRSPTYPITVWADTICINQGDIAERNQQLSLMSFIYTRAINVVAWLGTKTYPSRADVLRSMSIEWKAGRTQHFAAALAGASKMRYSPKPNEGTFARIAESTYWTRLWIVQEVCLPLLLVFVYGSEIWKYEEIRQWNFLPAAEHSLPQPGSNGYGAMLQLLETRDKRHTNVMTLESLIERFTRYGCTELKDRVYGLLGCANDIHPFVGRDERNDSLREYINSLSAGSKPECEPRRGIGSIRVDYSRSFFDLWMSVVNFVFFQANNVEGRIPIRLGSDTLEQAGNRQMDVPLNEERRISIVRTAGIVQDALGQKVEEEFASAGHTAVSRMHLGCISRARRDRANCGQNEPELPVIRAMGYVAGEIVQIGPDYWSLIGSSRAQQGWTSCWVDHYQKTEDLEILRRINEEYTAKIRYYEEKDVDRIRCIYNPHITAWCVGHDKHQLKSSDSSYPVEYKMMCADMDADKQTPRICLGTGYVTGLVPPTAKPGDVIIRFWNCDAAIVMRPIKTSIADVEIPSFMLIGRADVAEVVDRNATPGRDPHAEQCMLGTAGPGLRQGSQHLGAVYVDLNWRTLQIITAYIAF